jgi:hypothetical protein
MAASQGATGGNGGGANSSSGALPSWTARWTGLLAVWYWGLNSDLVVGPVEGAGAAGLFLGLAAQA